MAFYLLIEIWLLFVARKPILPEEWKILRLTPGQIVGAQWDWPFMKTAAIALSASGILLFLPHRLVFFYRADVFDEFETFPIYVFLGGENFIDANRQMAASGLAAAALIFCLHRTTLLARAFGLRFLATRWAAAWPLWLAATTLFAFEGIHRIHWRWNPDLPLHLIHLALLAVFLPAPRAMHRAQFEDE